MTLQVAAAILDPRFLSGTHAIEYGDPAKGAYHVHQVRVANDGSPMLIERHRGFKAKLTDPWPPWRVLRGHGVCDQGFYGIWLPHLPTLVAPCRIVALDPNDKPVTP